MPLFTLQSMKVGVVFQKWLRQVWGLDGGWQSRAYNGETFLPALWQPENISITLCKMVWLCWGNYNIFWSEMGCLSLTYNQIWLAWRKGQLLEWGNFSWTTGCIPQGQDKSTNWIHTLFGYNYNVTSIILLVIMAFGHRTKFCSSWLMVLPSLQCWCLESPGASLQALISGWEKAVFV